VKLDLFWSDSCPRDPRPAKKFAQKMLNRLMVGQWRYGAIKTTQQQFMTRLGKEYQAYKKTGNAEHLINIANYAFLESETPENKRYHFDATATSVTRGD
jgi:hypothetical protein